jgi:hypothetical protein
MKVTLVAVAGVIREATYETYQCPACHDCGKAVCSMVKGRSMDLARGVTRDSVAGRVGPLPRGKAICYSLAALALADAVGRFDQGR